jgi:hypothetical protein
LAEEWDYERNGDLNPTDVTVHCGKKVWWRCKKDPSHSWQATVNDRSSGTGCPFCSGRKACPGKTDLATTRPDLAAEWDYEKNGELRPTDVSAGSNKKVWWKCKTGNSKHVWQATVVGRAAGSGCPFCCGQKICPGETDLTTTHPQLAAEWDYEHNGDLRPTDVSAGSGKKVWWKCKIGNPGHVWQATVASRVRGNGCPFCRKERRMPAGWNAPNDEGTVQVPPITNHSGNFSFLPHRGLHQKQFVLAFD